MSGFDRPREDRLFSETLSSDAYGNLTGPSALTTTTGNGSAFTNQPSGFAVRFTSSNAADTTQTWTLIGTTDGTDTVVVETGLLNGTSVVTTAKSDWGLILAVKLSASAAGTVTLKEADSAGTITTLATTVLSKGVNTVLAANQSAWNRTVSLVANGSTTKQVGLKGTNSSGTVIYDSQALTGAVPVPSNSAFVTVTEIYTGDVEANRTVTETATAGTTLDGEFISTGLAVARVSSQFDKTNDTLADVTGLSLPVSSGATYKFEAVLDCAVDATGGSKIAIGGTATATAVFVHVASFQSDSSVVYGHATALGSGLSIVGANTAETNVVRGTITVNAGGTITVQYAQASANGTSSVLVGSTFTRQRIA